MKVPFGRKHENGIEIRGESPFTGHLLSFVPIPEGYKGKTQVHRTKTLAEIVQQEENSVYRMGTTPTVYYEYQDGLCNGYYRIERKEE
jgi:hypothetical protein